MKTPEADGTHVIKNDEGHTITVDVVNGRIMSTDHDGETCPKCSKKADA